MWSQRPFGKVLPFFFLSYASDLSIRVDIWYIYLIINLGTRREVTFSLSFGFMLFHFISVCFLISDNYHLWRCSSLLCIPLSHSLNPSLWYSLWTFYRMSINIVMPSQVCSRSSNWSYYQKVILWCKFR